MTLFSTFIRAHFLFGLFLLGSFCLFTTPITDGDLFWHINTGATIWQQKAIPVRDPFSFTVTDHNPFRPESQRVQYILRQNWLAQPVLYGAWKLGGPAAIVLLRASIYSFVLLIMYRWMRRTSGEITTFSLLLLVSSILHSYPNERPQLFAVLLFVPFLNLLELLKNTKENQPREAAAALVLLMVVWGNIHGSSLLGVAILAAYAIGHLLTQLHNRLPVRFNFILTLTVALLASFVTPNGILPLIAYPKALPAYVNSITEYLSPLAAARDLKEYLPAYWIFLGLACGTLIIRFRRVEACHVIVIIALALLSLTALRYTLFLTLLAPLLAPYLPRRQFNPQTSRAAMAAIILWIAALAPRKSFAFAVHPSFPAEACRFLNKAQPARNLFNYYDWGGYIITAVPTYKVFIDGRGLVEEIYLLHDEALNARNWQQIFDAYHINTLIIPAISSYSGTAYPLITILLSKSEWHLVHGDANAVVFVRDCPENMPVIRDYAMDKQNIHRFILAKLDWLIADSPANEKYWLSKANSHQLLGEHIHAMDSYRRVIAINPSNQWARRMLHYGQ